MLYMKSGKSTTSGQARSVTTETRLMWCSDNKNAVGGTVVSTVTFHMHVFNVSNQNFHPS